MAQSPLLKLGSNPLPAVKPGATAILSDPCPAGILEGICANLLLLCDQNLA